ncbi:MAG: hypothetical protein K8J31_29750 [Anaerolineae bacterium]|nr:hypothetical protein [Anaerolineae bacterium]
MDAPTIREKLVAELDDLRDEDMAEVLEFMLVLKAEADHLAEYNAAHDPVLTGEDLFDGPGDLSIRDEEILYGDPPREDV